MDLPQARAAIIEKLEKAGTKGEPSLATASVLTTNQATFDEALAALEQEGIALVNREGAKPKYYLKEFAPSHRKSILEKLQKAGAKGSAALYTPSASANTRAAIENEAALLESEGEIVVDRSGEKRKYYLKSLAPEFPILEDICAKLEEFASAKYPEMVSEAELKKQLSKAEAASPFKRAIQLMEGQRELVRLRHGRTALFASGRALRAALGEGISNPPANPSPQSQPPPESIASPDNTGIIRQTYRVLAERSGFPSVKIAALQRESGVALPALHRWLRDEYQHGRAVLSFGDWSLSDEATRSAALEIRGEHYLLVKLRE